MPLVGDQVAALTVTGVGLQMIWQHTRRRNGNYEDAPIWSLNNGNYEDAHVWSPTNGNHEDVPVSTRLTHIAATRSQVEQ